MGKPGGRKNYLRKITAEYNGYSRRKTHGYYTEKYLEDISYAPPKKSPYILQIVEYTIKFLHPKFIPINDPRRNFYVGKLKE